MATKNSKASTATSTTDVDKVLEELRRLVGASEDRRRITPEWDEKTRDNEKADGKVVKPGAK